MAEIQVITEEQACVQPLCVQAPESPGQQREVHLQGAAHRRIHTHRGLPAAAGLALIAAVLGAAMYVRGLRSSMHFDVGPGEHQSGEYLSRSEAAERAPGDGRKPITFYVYRAGSKATYPLDNVNVADLAGVMWYLHNEVIVSTPRKYSIDRIRRYKLTLKNTQEFWNVHHRNFGAFLAFDAARCTTPMCGSVFSQYGFIVGCQVLPTDVAPYLGKYITQVNGACKGKLCNAPVWYSLPGACPVKGLSNDEISGNSGAQDVTSAKGATCMKEQPGGHCDSANGAPDCTFSVEEAGEIMLDDLVGIGDYNHFWNVSYIECERDVKAGTRSGPCLHKKEFDVERDEGTGCSFWDGKADADSAAQRMKAVRDLFKKHFPEMPYDLEEPACDFDMYYDGEDSWPINHTGAITPERGFSWSKAAAMKTTTTSAAPSASAAGARDADEPMSCKDVGCGGRGKKCDCNAMCKKYNDCCHDYEDMCLAVSDSKAAKAIEASVAANTGQHHVGTGSRNHVEEAKASAEPASEVSPACREAQLECATAVEWAKTHGFFEHPDWYEGLTSTSPEEDFQKLLAKTKHGGCDKVCTSAKSHMMFLKRKLAIS